MNTKFLQTILGSSLIFSAQGGRGKEKNQMPAAKNFASPSEGEAEGGCGGNSAAPEPKRSPAALLVQSRVPQKSFLFLLEEKEIARQIKKCEENFFAEQRAKRAAAGRSELVGILFKMSSDFFQQTPPSKTSLLLNYCLKLNYDNNLWSNRFRYDGSSYLATK